MTRDDMIIRAVRQDDFATWLPLWDGYNEFYGRVGPTALTPEVTALTWSRLLDPAVPMQALVAEQDGKLLGITHYLYHLGTMQAETICYLSDLFTVPAARGEGVGRRLITAVYDAAGAAGAARVYWHTHETNATAMQLYDKVAEKSGFLVYRKML